MSSTYSSSLRIELIGSGDQAGAWGATTDSNLAYVLDTAIAGYQAVTVSSTSQALTYVNGPSSSAALNQSVYAILKFNGASAASAIYAPPVSKQYILWNNTSYTITIYNSTVIGNTTAAGTGVALAAGEKIMVWSDGTNFYDLQVQNLTGTLAIAKGGTGQTTATAAFNALAPSQASASGKYLKSDGTNASWDQIDVGTADITGTLPIANGGTGQATQQAALNAIAGTQTANRVLRSDGTNTSFSQVALATDVTGTLPVSNGGTGASTLTNAAILRGNGTSAVSAASAADIVAAISTTAVALSTNSTNAIGYNQTWQDVTGSRSVGTTYTNSTGKPIMVAITYVATSSGDYGGNIDVGGVRVATANDYAANSGYITTVSAIVPNGSTYAGSYNRHVTLQSWVELR
jgi:hypothetical protein